MQRWVLDSNVVLDWLVFDDPATRPLAAWLDAARALWLSCAPMRAELDDVIARPGFARHGVDLGARLHALHARYALEVPTPATNPRLRCRDADDQVFIDLALQQRADCLFTRDGALLELAPRALTYGLRIAPPAALAT